MTLQVSAILLAAGQSRRMETLKQLLPLSGKPVMRHCLDTIIGAGIGDIVVVLNPRVTEIMEAIRGLPLTVLFNNEPSSEMAESVRIGLRSARATSGVLIHLSDYPLVSVNTVRKLVARHKKEPDKILIPTYKNKRGHPCVFPKQCANEVFQGFTLKEIVHKDNGRIRLVPVQDEGILLDMDTEKDYDMMIRHMSLKTFGGK